MSAPLEVKVLQDTATPALSKLARALSPGNIKRVVGTAVARLIQEHLLALPPNKQGWPTTGFYAGAARGTSWDQTPEGASVFVDNEARPGAMRQRFHGGTIEAKDKLLTIPARAEFYGHRATDFTNLRLAVFKSGPALVVGKGGAGIVDFATGRERSVKGAGAREATVVAFWLRDKVEQDADPSVLPTEGEMVGAAVDALQELAVHEGGARA